METSMKGLSMTPGSMRAQIIAGRVTTLRRESSRIPLLKSVMIQEQCPSVLIPVRESS